MARPSTRCGWRGSAELHSCAGVQDGHRLKILPSFRHFGCYKVVVGAGEADSAFVEHDDVRAEAAQEVFVVGDDQGGGRSR